MHAVATLGSASDHGGHIVSASSTVFAEGQGVARLGDMHACPVPFHGVTPIVSTPAQTRADGRRIACAGAKAGCGATLLGGAPSVVVVPAGGAS